MHTTIITPYPLQGEIFANTLKRQNILCTICTPKNIELTSTRTDAVIIPHPIKTQIFEKTFKFIKELSKGIPLILIGASINNKSIIEKLKNNLQRTIFINEQLSNLEIAKLMQEIILKTNTIEEEKIKIGPFILDLTIRQLTGRGEKINLTKKEFFLLELLRKNLGQITTRESIMEYVWDKRNFVAQNTIDVYISRLRKKLKTKSGRPKIETIPCLGYRLII